MGCGCVACELVVRFACDSSAAGAAQHEAGAAVTMSQRLPLCARPVTRRGGGGAGSVTWGRVGSGCGSLQSADGPGTGLVTSSAALSEVGEIVTAAITREAAGTRTAARRPSHRARRRPAACCLLPIRHGPSQRTGGVTAAALAAVRASTAALMHHDGSASTADRRRRHWLSAEDEEPLLLTFAAHRPHNHRSITLSLTRSLCRLVMEQLRSLTLRFSCCPPSSVMEPQ